MVIHGTMLWFGQHRHWRLTLLQSKAYLTELEEVK